MNVREPGPEIRETTVGDGTVLRYRDWRAASPRGTVVCTHGIRSHGAWYLDSCAHLYGKGYRVVFPDRRGSGLNRERGGGSVRCQQWLDDLAHFVALAGRELPGKPLHLLGISWGGRLAAAVAAANGTVRSVVLSTPGLVPRADLSWRTKLSVAAALFLKSDRLFPLPLEDPALFTDDLDEQHYIEEDAAGLRSVAARFLYESSRLERIAGTRFVEIRIPIYLLLAGRDAIVDNEGTKRLFESCRSPVKAMKTYERARHTLEFDACRAEYFDDLVKWFDSHS
jgi:alpha-beta hydrolase superfamily lysophospholipase